MKVRSLHHGKLIMGVLSITMFNIMASLHILSGSWDLDSKGLGILLSTLLTSSSTMRTTSLALASIVLLKMAMQKQVMADLTFRLSGNEIEGVPKPLRTQPSLVRQLS